MGLSQKDYIVKWEMPVISGISRFSLGGKIQELFLSSYFTINNFFEFFTSCKYRSCFSSDFNFCTCLRVTTCSCSSFSSFESTKTN